MSIELKTVKQLEEDVRIILNDDSLDHLNFKDQITEIKESLSWNFHTMRYKLLVVEQRIYELLPRLIFYFMKKRCQDVIGDIDCYHRIFWVIGK